MYKAGKYPQKNMAGRNDSKVRLEAMNKHKKTLFKGAKRFTGDLN